VANDIAHYQGFTFSPRGRQLAKRRQKGQRRAQTKECIMHRFAALALLVATPLSAQEVSASLDQLAATPLVTVQIAEQLRSPPDEATLTAGTESRAPTASAALAATKLKTEHLVEAIKAAGIASKDVQTEGVSVGADYEYETVNGRGEQHLAGYSARNTVRIKTRQIDRLVALLDTLTAAGATNIYGPNFSIADPAPLRAEARKRAMVRGEAEAGEYAHNAGFRGVQLLSVQEGVHTAPPRSWSAEAECSQPLHRLRRLQGVALSRVKSRRVLR
jgi:uncharacterized protein YggE